jgi:hypothetical protein
MGTKTLTRGLWPPPELRLPDSIEAIEAGIPPRQRSLFGRDDSREGRLARILASVPGVQILAANRLESAR